MKLFERVILGIFRKPVKSMILLCVMFVICSMLSCSLILYNTTQSTKDKVNHLVAPTMSIESPLSVLSTIIVYFNNEQLTTLSIAEQDLYNKMQEYEEIEYGDYGNFYFFNRHPVEDYMLHKLNPERMPVSDLFVTTNNYKTGYQENKHIQLVEGRGFTEEEIKKGSNVVIVSNESSIYRNGKYEMLEVGDRISLLSYIHKDAIQIDDSLLSSNLSHEELNNEILKYNQLYKDNLYDTLDYEVEVIGIYRGNAYLTDFIWNRIYGILPEKFVNNITQDIYDQNLKLYENDEIEVMPKIDSIKFNNFNHYLINDPENVEKVSKTVKGELEKLNALVSEYEKDTGKNFDRYQLVVSTETYLKVAGPLESMNMVSKTIVIGTLIIGSIILWIISTLFIKDRMKEIGILLTLGETKRRVMAQILCEVMLIGVLAIGLSIFSSSYFSDAISDTVLENNQIKIELTKEEQELLGDITQKSILQQYRTDLESKDTLLLVFVTSAMISVTSMISVLFVLKMNPKDILM